MEMEGWNVSDSADEVGLVPVGPLTPVGFLAPDPANDNGGLGWAIDALSPQVLRRLVADEQARRGIIRQFVDEQLQAGVDYGVVGYNKRAKPCLYKSGAEKVCSWLALRAHFEVDMATMEMAVGVGGMGAGAGGGGGLYAYTCYLLDERGLVGAEGRGAAELRERAGWTPNNAIKMACKRAMVDAVLRAVGLSEMFTQDLEDASERRAMEMEGAQEAQGAQKESTI
jgi:hypothetical protein